MLRTHNSPENTLQLVEKIDILRLESMLANELSELSEMTLLAKDLTSLVGLGELAVEMRRDGSVEDPARKREAEEEIGRLSRDERTDEVKGGRRRTRDRPRRLPRTGRRLSRGRARPGRRRGDSDPVESRELV